MDGRTFRGHVRVSYSVDGRGRADRRPAPSVTATYHEGNRALEIKFAKPLSRFQTVKVELLDGIAAMDSQVLPPWSMTFSTRTPRAARRSGAQEASPAPGLCR